MMSDEENEEFGKFERLARNLIKVRKADLDRLRAGEDLGHLEGDYEPVPVGKEAFSGKFSSPKPFGSPPDEPVEVVGDVPWELRDDDAPELGLDSGN